MACALALCGTAATVISSGTIPGKGPGGIHESREPHSSYAAAALGTRTSTTAPLQNLAIFGQFLLLISVAVGFASFPGALFAGAVAMWRARGTMRSDLLGTGSSRPMHNGVLRFGGGLLPGLFRSRAGTGTDIPARFSMTWALWRSPNPVGEQLLLLGVALATLWVYVFNPRFSFGKGQGLLINFIAGAIVLVRIGARSRIFADLTKRSTNR